MVLFLTMYRRDVEKRCLNHTEFSHPWLTGIRSADEYAEAVALVAAAARTAADERAALYAKRVGVEAALLLDTARVRFLSSGARLSGSLCTIA